MATPPSRSGLCWILSIGRHLGRSTTFMSRLTGQSSDHEKLSYELPGALAPVRLTTNCWKAKTFSFSFDFFQKQVTLDRDLSALSNKNEERLAGYAELGITGLMPSSGLCRGKGAPIALEQQGRPFEPLLARHNSAGAQSEKHRVFPQFPRWPEPNWRPFEESATAPGQAVELEVAIRYIHIEVRPADYAEIVALPISSICGCGEFPRHNPELGIRPVMPSSA